MSWKIAIQGPSGRLQLAVEPTMPLSALLAEVAQKSGIPKARSKILCGHPPQDLSLSGGGKSSTIEDAGVQNGDMLRLVERTAEEMAVYVSSLNQITTQSGRTFSRKVVDADNSCMFTCVSLGLENGRKDMASELREICASIIMSDPVEYSEAVLGKPNEVYCTWILQRDSWGGGIELGILSKHYQSEIAAIDVQTVNVYRFGEGNGYSKVVFLVFDGIHYDIMVEVQGGDEVRMFAASDAEALEACTSLVRGLSEAKHFIDIQGFSLKCMVCGLGLKGAQEAQEHAEATGHQNFAQYE